MCGVCVCVLSRTSSHLRKTFSPHVFSTFPSPYSWDMTSQEAENPSVAAWALISDYLPLRNIQSSADPGSTLQPQLLILGRSWELRLACFYQAGFRSFVFFRFYFLVSLSLSFSLPHPLSLSLGVNDFGRPSVTLPPCRELACMHTSCMRLRALLHVLLHVCPRACLCLRAHA